MAAAHAEAQTQATRPQKSGGTGEDARVTVGGAMSFGTGETPNAINLRLFVSHCHSALYGASASEGLLAQWCDLNSLQQEATDGQYSYGVGCA
jgi:hypothetical protein